MIRRLINVYKKKGLGHIIKQVLKIISFKLGVPEAWYKIFEKFHNINSFLYSKLHNKPLIYVIGDSHVRTFKNKKQFSLHNIGPATAYNLKNKKSTTNSNQKLFIVLKKINKQKDIVMLSFGEIDCRVHIYNIYRKNQKFTISELIDNTISNYGEVLKQLKEIGIIFCIYSIPPAGEQFYLYNNSYSNYSCLNPHLICSQIKREFNEKLELFCKENNFKFINIYKKVTDENGLILKELSTDDVHLNNKAVEFVIVELNKVFNLSI